MKTFLPLGIFFLVSFFAFTTSENPAIETSENSELTFTTISRICDFRAFFYPGGIGPCSSDALALEINHECLGAGEANVRAVNLSSNPQIGEMYSLPSGMPDLYYEYTTTQNGTTVIGPVDGFMFNGEYHVLYNGTLMPVFEFSADLFVDVTEECKAFETANISMEVRLIDETGHLYPVSDYSEFNQVFYCGVFSETCGTCSFPPPTCGNGSPPEYFTLACGECNGCGIDQDEIDKSISNKPRTPELFSPRAEENDETILTSFSVQPNPFTNEIRIAYNLQKVSDLNVDVLDAKGSILVQKNLVEQQGETSLSLDLSQLVEGVYFCRIQVEEEVFIHKIIKL